MSFLLIEFLDLKFLVELQHQPYVCAIERESLFDGLLHGVLLRLCEVLETPNLAIVGWQVLKGVPVAILDGLNTSVLDESLTRFLI